MNEENGKNNVTSYNNVKKNYAHLASEIKANQTGIPNFYYGGQNDDQSSVLNNEENVNQTESMLEPGLSQIDEGTSDNDNEENINDFNEIQDKLKNAKKAGKKIGKRILLRRLWKKYKIPIILGGSGILILVSLILLVGFLPNAGGILELTNNNENNQFESKDEGANGEVVIGDDSVPYLVNDGFTHFFQYNYAHVSYGYGTTIATSGCCPTAMAMILTNITGQMITPIETADYSLKNGYRVEGNGTAWAFMPAVSSAYGVTCTQINTDAASISNSLLSGKLISMSVNPGHFSSGGHFIVLRKVTEDGRIIVADPNSEERSKMAWDISIFPSEAAAAWACSK